LKTGVGEFPAKTKIDVFPVKIEGGDVLVNLESAGTARRQESQSVPPAV
jgi:hypothetical protein